jgi:hydrogenase nickel incorporation protein HypB
MCGHCGCAEGGAVTITRVGGEAGGARPHRHEHGHHHDPAHGAHHHDHGHQHLAGNGATVELGQAILAKNDQLAAANRRWLAAQGILALNLVSGPGAGKTTLLERTIQELGQQLPLAVIEGDQATTHDAERIGAAGCRAVQINTGAGCHLDAHMIAHALPALAPEPGSLLLIENVGNLVCPSLFDLGEAAKVAILSVTEGEDKPAKYPHMIKTASLLLLNKIDLLPHLRFDLARCIDYARAVNPAIEIIEVSALTGQGMADWYGWLRAKRAKRAALAAG